MRFGKIIKKRREDFQMTQEELANATQARKGKGISRARIIEIEQGEMNKLTWGELEQIGYALSLNHVVAWIKLDYEIRATVG